jgi:CheY-like chemotaxis protein
VLAGSSTGVSFPPEWDVVRADSPAQAMSLVQEKPFDAVVAPTHEFSSMQQGRSYFSTEALLNVLEDGIAVIHPDGRILWANATFEQWCCGPVQNRDFLQSLGSPKMQGNDASLLSGAFLGQPLQTRLQQGQRTIDLRLTPLRDGAGHVEHVIALCRDVTAEIARQHMLDAIHQAGRELAGLNADKLAEMDTQERIDFLTHQIRRFTHDLLHYDVIEIRLLDPKTGRLVPLLAEGIMPEAQSRVLFARESGNGVTGYVAATGKTYVCADAAHDPHFIEGAKGAKSSLTVALKWDEKVIGTFNVENPSPNAFTPENVQFTEIFCRELATALHTFELLMVEKQATATRSLEAVNREVALPVDEILTTATSILDRWIGHEPEMAEKLKKIMTNARAIKQSIHKVGEDINPSGPVLPMVKGPETPSKLRSMRVLVVDNDDRVRRSAHSLLGRLGCIVETARDGAEALTLARLSSYHAIITDIRLPDISGYEVYRQLRQAQPHAHVILMTGFGYDSTHSLVKARQDGLKHILYKPFKVEQLVSALENPDPEASKA